MKPNRFLKGRACIYGIRNVTNGKIYVGRTTDFLRRGRQYVYDFKEQRIGHINAHLLASMKKHGIDSFDMFPLEFCPVAKLKERELYWMNHLRSSESNFGYNLRMDSEGAMIVHSDTSLKISKRLRKEWSTGMRAGHSAKLRDDWASSPNRRVQQAGVLRSVLTKYSYVIKSTNGSAKNLKYSDLVSAGYKNVISTFHRAGVDEVTFKGVRIKRVPL